MFRHCVPIAFVTISLGCGGLGDDSAIRTFRTTVRVGDSLPDVIAAGEKAQAFDIEYRVRSRACPTDELLVERHSFQPLIRVSHATPERTQFWEQAYDETGYATREDFARGLSEIVPKFYACKDFVFTFARLGGWPSSDSFTVTVDADGKLTAVSDLTRDQVD